MVNSGCVYEQTNIAFVSNRFGNSNSAFRLQNGFVRVANNTYFSGEFTVTAWVKLNAYLTHQRLIDFGNGECSDNVLISLSGFDNKIYFHVFYKNTPTVLNSNAILSLNIWHHVSFTCLGNIMKIYVNGSMVANKTGSISNIVRSVLRQRNYIGRSNWNSDPHADLDFSDLKIYSKELSDLEIYKDYNSVFL
ncbi:unnamed protein product [Brachionus calyciflorus]|uniref:LamG-like jellyroll fold domain-containing protein n=1 Tax=Brachionus calyciflorus TaxID=104777 RepID=A0A814I0G9_9BILA|nr:unnamed protein product [Brachionus calyciflorus]